MAKFVGMTVLTALAIKGLITIVNEQRELYRLANLGKEHTH